MMKKLSLALLICLFASQAYGLEIQGSRPCPGGGVVGCASGDTINETFDAADADGYDLTWTETGTTPDPDSTGYAFTTGGGGHVLYIAADTENELLYVTHDHGSELSTSYHRFKFYIADSSIGDGGTVKLANFSDAAGNSIVEVRIRNSSGQLEFLLNPHNETSGTLTSNISVDTEYTFELYWESDGATGGDWAWKVNGSQIGVTGAHTSTRYWQQTVLGVNTASAAASSINVYYECYGVSTAGWVGN